VNVLSDSALHAAYLEVITGEGRGRVGAIARCGNGLEEVAMRSARFVFVLVLVFGLVAAVALGQSVKDDQNLFMPGSQQGDVSLESSNRCGNCHGGYNQAAEPYYNWNGSMMAQAARDPLWIATMAVALQDSKAVLGNYNAGDLCIRCHSPMGWLGGRSEPTNTSALTGSDFEGVACDFCHKMVDPIAARMQDDVPAEGTSLGITEAANTYQMDLTMLSPLSLFDGTPFFSPSSDLPTHYGDGGLPNYVESGSGQFFVDASTPKRGPRADAEPKHQWAYSRYHQSKYFCATCHDVSNPVVGRLQGDDPEKQAAATYGHVERTFSEFMLSAYGNGGAMTADAIGVGVANKCQDCHMRNVTGPAANKRGIAVRDDLALHDITGGNAWMSGILASVDQSGPTFDPYNYAILSGAKYGGASIDVGGIQGFGQALVDGQARALQQLQMAATLAVVTDDPGTLAIRVTNNSGHKLISGYPEGRRMFLNVAFYDANGLLLGEVNQYDPLVTATDAGGNESYVSGGVLGNRNEELIWEAHMSSEITGEDKTQHFVLATGREKDNRIPPRGFQIASAAERMVVPVWNGVEDPGYFTSAEYEGGYDEVTVAKPAGATSWAATLYYQTTSKEYVEFLRDEINGSGNITLGIAGAYIAQSDPFFSNLKGWGNAMWDLWLHNGGSAPVAIASIYGGEAPPGPSCDPLIAPSNLTATGTKRSVTLSWGAVTDASEYNVYLSQGGKYALVGTTTETTYKDNNLKVGETFCYAVTAVRDCGENGTSESDYSNESCAVPQRK
jgi:hypothetical protein